MGERTAEITLIVNTTGYSRRKDDVRMCVMQEQMFWSGPADGAVRRINRWSQESVVCVGSVELREAEDRPLAARLAFLESLFSYVTQ